MSTQPDQQQLVLTVDNITQNQKEITRPLKPNTNIHAQNDKKWGNLGKIKQKESQIRIPKVSIFSSDNYTLNTVKDTGSHSSRVLTNHNYSSQAEPLQADISQASNKKHTFITNLSQSQKAIPRQASKQYQADLDYSSSYLPPINKQFRKLSKRANKESLLKLKQKYEILAKEEQDAQQQQTEEGGSIPGDQQNHKSQERVKTDPQPQYSHGSQQLRKGNNYMSQVYGLSSRVNQTQESQSSVQYVNYRDLIRDNQQEKLLSRNNTILNTSDIQNNIKLRRNNSSSITLLQNNNQSNEGEYMHPLNKNGKTNQISLLQPYLQPKQSKAHQDCFVDGNSGSPTLKKDILNYQIQVLRQLRAKEEELKVQRLEQDQMVKTEAIQTKLAAHPEHDRQIIKKMLLKQENDEFERQLTIIQNYEIQKRNMGEFTSQSLTEEIQASLHQMIDDKIKEEAEMKAQKEKERLEKQKYIKDFQKLFSHRLSQLSLTDELLDQQFQAHKEKQKAELEKQESDQIAQNDNQKVFNKQTSLFASIIANSALKDQLAPQPNTTNTQKLPSINVISCQSGKALQTDRIEKSCLVNGETSLGFDTSSNKSLVQKNIINNKQQTQNQTAVLIQKAELEKRKSNQDLSHKSILVRPGQQKSDSQTPAINNNIFDKKKRVSIILDEELSYVDEEEPIVQIRSSAQGSSRSIPIFGQKSQRQIEMLKNKEWVKNLNENEKRKAQIYIDELKENLLKFINLSPNLSGIVQIFTDITSNNPSTQVLLPLLKHFQYKYQKQTESTQSNIIKHNYVPAALQKSQIPAKTLNTPTNQRLSQTSSTSLPNIIDPSQKHKKKIVQKTKNQNQNVEEFKLNNGKSTICSHDHTVNYSKMIQEYITFETFLETQQSFRGLSVLIQDLSTYLLKQRRVHIKKVNESIKANYLNQQKINNEISQKRTVFDFEKVLASTKKRVEYQAIPQSKYQKIQNNDKKDLPLIIEDAIDNQNSQMGAQAIDTQLDNNQANEQEKVNAQNDNQEIKAEGTPRQINISSIIDLNRRKVYKSAKKVVRQTDFDVARSVTFKPKRNISDVIAENNVDPKYQLYNLNSLVEKRSKMIDQNMESLDSEMKDLLEQKLQSSFKAVLFTPYQFQKFKQTPNKIRFKKAH